jgi:hypothetical protein
MLEVLPCAARGQEQKLSSAEIRRLITGKTVTDEVHYTEKFKAGGVYEGVFMNKRLTGSWKVRDGQLCVARGSDPETCDEFGGWATSCSAADPASRILGIMSS